MRLKQSTIDRRDFLDGLMLGGLVAVGGAAGETILGYLTGLEVPEPDLIEIKGEALGILAREHFVLVPYGPSPVMVFQLPGGELRALSAVCTHGQCNVRYRPESNDIFCGCHEGRFTAEGVNVPGTPPPRPLRQFHVHRRDAETLLVAAKPFEDTDTEDQPAEATTPAKG